MLLGAAIVGAAAVLGWRCFGKVLPKPRTDMDPVTLEDIKNFLEYAGPDSLSYVRQPDGVIHILMVDGNAYDNATYWPEQNTRYN
jgi:hypothetical protein